MEQYSNRREDLSTRPKTTTTEIVTELRTALRDLFKQIEVAQIKNGELDYTPLVDELNLDIAEYKKQIKFRASYNKKKANGAIDDNEVVIDYESGEEIETTETDTRMYPMSEEVKSMEKLRRLYR